MFANRAWISHALETILADRRRGGETPLVELVIPEARHVRFLFKDESRHPTGVAKHRLARALITYALASNWLRQGQVLIDAVPAPLAIGEAYFAQLIGSRFIAIVPPSAHAAHVEHLQSLGAEVRTADLSALQVTAKALAAETGGFYLDAATFGERALDWRGGGPVLSDVLFEQLANVNVVPDWIVTGATTGATIANLGRRIRIEPALASRTKLCAPDPVGSAYLHLFRHGDAPEGHARIGLIDTIGAPEAASSFQSSLIDRMIGVTEPAAAAACLWLEQRLRQRTGPATGAHIVAALALAAEMRREGREGVIASFIADAGKPYEQTLYNPSWRRQVGLDLSNWMAIFARFEREGDFVGALDDASADDISYGNVFSFKDPQ